MSDAASSLTRPSLAVVQRVVERARSASLAWSYLPSSLLSWNVLAQSVHLIHLHLFLQYDGLGGEEVQLKSCALSLHQLTVDSVVDLESVFTEVERVSQVAEGSVPYSDELMTGRCADEVEVKALHRTIERWIQTQQLRKPVTSASPAFACPSSSPSSSSPWSHPLGIQGRAVRDEEKEAITLAEHKRQARQARGYPHWSDQPIDYTPAVAAHLTSCLSPFFIPDLISLVASYTYCDAILANCAQLRSCSVHLNPREVRSVERVMMMWEAHDQGWSTVNRRGQVSATWMELEITMRERGAPPTTIMQVPLAYNDAANNTYQGYHLVLDNEGEWRRDEDEVEEERGEGKKWAEQFHCLLSLILPLCNRQLERMRREEATREEMDSDEVMDEGECGVELSIVPRQKFAGWGMSTRNVSMWTQVEKMTPNTHITQQSAQSLG